MMYLISQYIGKKLWMHAVHQLKKIIRKSKVQSGGAENYAISAMGWNQRGHFYTRAFQKTPSIRWEKKTGI